jgi:hypothetical protein
MKDVLSGNDIELTMSNSDRSIDEGFEDALKADTNNYGQYAGYNFCGYVWFALGWFTCQVWTHGEACEEIKATNLEDIMREVSGEYGWE